MVCHDCPRITKANEKLRLYMQSAFSCKRNGTEHQNIQGGGDVVNLLLPLQGDWLSRGIYSLIYHCRIRIFVPCLFMLSWHSYPLICSLTLLSNPLADNNLRTNSLSALLLGPKAFIKRKITVDNSSWLIYREYIFLIIKVSPLNWQ